MIWDCSVALRTLNDWLFFGVFWFKFDISLVATFMFVTCHTLVNKIAKCVGCSCQHGTRTGTVPASGGCGLSASWFKRWHQLWPSTLYTQTKLLFCYFKSGFFVQLQHLTTHNHATALITKRQERSLRATTSWISTRRYSNMLLAWTWSGLRIAASPIICNDRLDRS